jgi:DNA-directed RNA polymerase specialized sigma24 family protein
MFQLTPELEALFDQLPPKEADTLYLYFVRHKRIADIAGVYGVTRAAISYRIQRGIQPKGSGGSCWPP